MLMDKVGTCQEGAIYPGLAGASVMESKIGIEALLLAARYLEEKEEKAKELERLSPEHQSHQIPMTIVQTSPVLQHVVQQQQATQSIPIQHVTIQHHALPLQPTNGHHLGNNITLATQQVNAIRINKQDVVSVTPASIQMNPLSVMNSFDLINRPVIDQGSGEVKRKQPPMAFRTGTREVHNKLEKNRRAHLKECFDDLYAELPNAKDSKKTSNLNILDSAIKYISALETEKKSYEKQIELLAKDKIMLQQKFNNLKKEIMAMHNIDVSMLMPEIVEESALTRLTRSDTLVVKDRLEQLTATTITLKPSSPLQEKQEVTNGHGQHAVLSTTPTVNATPLTVVGNVLKLPKSIKGTLPVVATSTNGIKENTNTGVATSATATTVSVLPAAAFGYHPIQQNGGLVLQKVIVPKGITGDHLTAQFVSTGAGGQLTHFMDGNGKVMPTIVNAQYVVVSTPSRPS